MATKSEQPTTVWDRLAAPFDDLDIKLRPLEVKTAKDWKKPQKQYGKYTEACKAKYAVYIDARNVEDRLDEVVGAAFWTDEYVPLPDGSMKCRLSVRDPETEAWVYKEGVGYPNSEGDDEPYKGAESDSLKRAAVKWGIGRQLYSMTEYKGLNLGKWHDCDEYGQPGKVTQQPEPAPAPDADLASYTELMRIAGVTNNKERVKKALGNPKDGKAALDKWRRLNAEERSVVEKAADGTLGDAA